MDTLTAWPLVGRDVARRRLFEAFTGRRGAPPAVITGPAGVGKTRFLTEALDKVAAEGCPVVRVTASAAASTIPFGAVAHLLPDELAGADHLTVLRGAFRALAATVPGDGATAVLGVDDAHLLDPGSAAVVQRAAALTPLRVALTVRDGEQSPDIIERLTTHPATERIALDLLTEEQVATLLRHALAGPVTGPTVHRLAHLSEGNPLGLRELVREARRRDTLVRRGGAWRLDGSPVHDASLPDTLRTTMAGLDPDVRDVVAVVALSDVVGVEVLERLFGDDVLEAADVQGLLMAAPDRRRTELRLAHPLFGEAVLRQVGTAPAPVCLQPRRWRWAPAPGRTSPSASRAAIDAGAGMETRIVLTEAQQWTGRPDEAVAELLAVASPTRRRPAADRRGQST